MSDAATVAVPDVQRKAKPQDDPRTDQMPLYHVVLLNDDDHTYDYVIEMLGKLFGHTPERAFLMARKVDTEQRVIVDTTNKERAEFKRDQIHAYGPDPRLARSKGSMSAVIEPALSGDEDDAT